MKKILLILFCLPLFTYSQNKKVIIDEAISKTKELDINAVKSKTLKQELSSEIINDETAPKWNRSLINFDKKHKLSPEVQEEIDEKTNQKRNNLKEYYPDEDHKVGMQSNLTIGANFEGNWFDGGTPPDNSMAISNGGYIVSTINSNIEYYNSSGTLLYVASFDNLFNDGSLTSMIYDPVVLYDSGSDRFFMAVLHGSTPSTSKVLTCFSKTNNPEDGWWVYHLPGDPASSNTWFDYPKIGVSNNEVYITGNLFDASNNFVEAVIYQINKNDGYSGGTLTWEYWINISDYPFTLVPASYGQQGNYGPGIFLVSTEENNTNDKYRLYDLTDDISGSAQLNGYEIDADFSLAGNAFQSGTSVLLDNGGSRGLKAFYLDGILHFVFHSEKINLYSGINYNRLTVSSLSNWNSIFGLDGYDYAYPSVASFGTSPSDKSAVMGCLRSAASIYPEIRVVSCDNSGNWSSSSLVKEGETYVDVYEQGTGVTRWGDYTGISRKQNASSPEVWINGGFGKYRLNENAFDTWIAQVNNNTAPNAITEDPNPIDNKINVYPIPVFDMFSVEFSIENKTKVSIELIDISGKVVKVLYNDAVKKGRNMFSFNKGALPSGIYFLNIKTNSNTLKNEKIIIE